MNAQQIIAEKEGAKRMAIELLRIAAARENVRAATLRFEPTNKLANSKHAAECERWASVYTEAATRLEKS